MVIFSSFALQNALKSKFGHLGEFLCSVIQMCMLAKSWAEQLSRELWKCRALLITTPQRVCRIIMSALVYLDDQHEKSIYVTQLVNSVGLVFAFLFSSLSRLGPECGASAMGLITPLSFCIRFKATKPQGSSAAAACSAQQQLQIWWHRTSRCEGVSLPEKRREKKPRLLDLAF